MSRPKSVPITQTLPETVRDVKLPQTDVTKFDHIEEAKKVIEFEKKERGDRVAKEINMILARERCELHFRLAFDSRNPTNPVVDRMVLAK